jgi:hypothetical protein
LGDIFLEIIADTRFAHEMHCDKRVTLRTIIDGNIGQHQSDHVVEFAIQHPRSPWRRETGATGGGQKSSRRASNPDSPVECAVAASINPK